jgi:ABC-2 type transport system permease protein
VRRLVAAFLRRDLRIERSYRAALIGQAAGGLMFLATFAILTPVVRDDFEARFGTSYLSFVAVGLAVTGALLTALQAFSSSLREAQVEGTLEAMMLSPARSEDVVTAMGAWPLLVGTGFSVGTLAAAAVGGAELHIHPLTLVAAAALSLAAFVGLGLTGAAAVLVAQRGNPVATLIGMAGSLTAGAYAPVETFPGWLQAVAAANHMTYALDAWRAALLSGEPPAAVGRELVVLAGLAVVAVPLGRLSVKRALAVARRNGSLASY